MNRDESQDVVNQVNQELKDVRTGERIKEYIDTAISRAWRKQSQNNDNNGNNSGTSNRRRNGVLGVNILRKGRYFDRPDLYVKTSRADINEYDDIDTREGEADYRYSLRETNPEVLEQLNNGETIKAYRAMQVIVCSKAKIATNHHNKPFIFAFLTLKSYICARNEKREKNIYPFVAAGDGL